MGALKLRTLDVDVREDPVEPAGQPPRRVAGEVLTAGMSSIRTTKASTSTPKASPNPSGRMVDELEKTNPEKTEIMMIAAAVTTTRPARRPSRTASRAGAPWTCASRIPDTRNSW